MTRTRALAALAVVAAALAALGAGSYAVVGGGDAPSASGSDLAAKLPDRVGVIDAQGEFAGFVDSAALRKPPGNNYGEWLREPIPVTKTADRTSELVGYKFRTAGFVDRATYERPDFDVDALVAQAQAQSERGSRQFLESSGQAR